MIVRKIKTKILGKRREHQIGDLVDYVRTPHKRNADEKILYGGSRNFYSNTHVGQKYEMITLAGESIYSEMPVNHWVLSWPEDEHPTRQHVEEMVDIFLEQMGLVGHQTVYGLHGNTKNIHLHIAVNRMNEMTGMVVRVNKGFDIIQAHKAVAVIEDRQGWKPEKNARFKVVDGKITKIARPKKLQPSQAAQTFEQHTGQKSAERIAQEEAHAIIKNATSWADLHSKLAPLGIRYIKKGSGAIIKVDDTPVKASSVDRAFALGKMEKRLGEFVPCPDDKEMQTHPRPPMPVSQVNLDEWRTYQEEMAHFDNAAIRQEEQRLLEEERRKIDEEAEQQRAKLGNFEKKHGIFMSAIAKQAIAEERRKKRADALKKHRASRQKLPTRPTFKNWLLKTNRHDKADKWRYRKQLAEQEIMPKVVDSTKPEAKLPDVCRAHFDIILEKHGKENMDISRAEGMLAIRLRAHGYSREEVTEALQQFAPTIRSSSQANTYRFYNYADRTAAYAFGPAGDIVLHNDAELIQQAKLQSGVGLVDLVKLKQQELELAKKTMWEAEWKLRDATKEVERLQSAIKNHEEKVSNQGFWSGLINKGQNSSHSKELELEHKTATENEEMAKNDYNTKSSRVSKLETELRALQTAYANSALARELKRQAEEQHARELEAQRQKEEQARKEREAQQQQVEETPKIEETPQQYQSPRIRMR